MLTLQLSMKFNALQTHQPTDWITKQPTNQPTNQPKTVRYDVLRAVRLKITVFRMGTFTEIYHCFGARCCLNL